MSAQDLSDKNMSELEIKYLFTFVHDTLDLDSSHKAEETMILDLNANSSIYYSEAFMKRRIAIDNIINTGVNSKTIPEIKIADLPKYKIGYNVYRYGSQIFVTNNLYRDFFTFESEFLKWNTSFSEEKNILGYKCNKATTVFNKRLYIVWYTKGIPISEGPYRFKGLPGLILEVHDEKGYNSFQAIGIEKKQVEIKKLQKGVPVTREQYLQKREEYRNNPYPGKILDKAKKEQILEANVKNNNLFER